MLNYKKAAAVNVKKTDYRYWQGLALEKKLGKKAEAEALFEALVEAGKAAVVEDYVNFYGAEGTTGKTVATINTGPATPRGSDNWDSATGTKPGNAFEIRGAETRQPLVGGDAPGIETINDCKNESSTNTDARRLRGRCPDRAAGRGPEAAQHGRHPRRRLQLV